MKKLKLVPKDRRQMIKLHRELWGWLYDNPKNEYGQWNDKPNWPRWGHPYGKGDITPVHCECFACAHSIAIKRGCNDDNGGCPLFKGWGNASNDCIGDKGYFSKWIHGRTVKTRRRYAKLIRDLTVRPARK